MKTTIETLAGNLLMARSSMAHNQGARGSKARMPGARGSKARIAGAILGTATGSVRRAIYYNDPDPAD